MTFRLPHLFAALVLHAAILLLLAGGAQCSVKPMKHPVITGVLLDPSRQEVARRKRQEEEARRVTEQQKKVEAQKRAKAEADAKQKKDAEALRQKQLAEKKAAEKKKADEAARRQQDQAAREAAARREAERVEQAMQEEAARREARRAAQALAEDARLGQIAQWAEALAAHVQKYYSRPPGTPDTYSCKVRMQLLPDGRVTAVSVVKSCGSPFIDQAVIAAVNDSSPVPLPADRSVFDPDLTINFSP